VQGGDAGFGHVVDDIAALKAEHGRDREDAFGKLTSRRLQDRVMLHIRVGVGARPPPRPASPKPRRPRPQTGRPTPSPSSIGSGSTPRCTWPPSPEAAARTRARYARRQPRGRRHPAAATGQFVQPIRGDLRPHGRHVYILLSPCPRWPHTLPPQFRRVVVATELITTVAGTGTSGCNGGDIAAVGAQLPEPSGVAA
jgi:hypothetical protein